LQSYGIVFILKELVALWIYDVYVVGENMKLKHNNFRPSSINSTLYHG